MKDQETPGIPGAAGDDVATAEAQALAAERDENAAYERFVSLRSSLDASGKAHEATQHPEFRRWMDSREATDAAWGRWAMAMDALQDA